MVVGGLAAVLLLVTIWQVVPAGIRTLLFHSSSSNRLPPITDPSIHLPPIEYTRALITEREKQRQRSSSSSSSSSSYSTARRAILERLAPAWFHRNDPDYNYSDPAQQKTTAAAAVADEKDGTAKEVEGKEEIVANQQEKKEEEKKLSGELDETSPTLPIPHHQDTEDNQPPPPLPPLHRQLRKLDNMDDYPNSSACAAAKTTMTTTTKSSLEDETLSVTLVLQTSPDRLWILHETCQRWTSHPIVVVVAVDHADDGGEAGDGTGGKASLSTEAMISAAQTACGANLDLVVHRLDEDELSSPYPVNVLRNMGLGPVMFSCPILILSRRSTWTIRFYTMCNTTAPMMIITRSLCPPFNAW
jgi:hypothetical protein